MRNKQNLTLNSQTDNIKECVQNLYIYSETGNSKKLKELTDNKEYSVQTLNIAFRKLITKFEANEEYENCIKILMSLNFKVNYKLTNDNSSTILMCILGKGDIVLLKTFLTLFLKNEKSEKIKFELRDAKNRNAIHHLFIKNSLETDVIDIINYLLEDYCKNDENLYNNIISLLDTCDLDENVPLGICLLKGWLDMTLKLIKLVKNHRHVNNKKNNFIHLCVLGNRNSILCLKIMLYYSKIEDLKSKNCDGLTPYKLAYNNGYVHLCTIINEYEKNFNNVIYKNSFFTEFERYSRFGYNDLILNTLNYFSNGEYENCIVNLKNCRYYHNYIKSGDDDGKIYNCSIEWNYFLSEHKLNLESEQKNVNKEKNKDGSKKNKDNKNNVNKKKNYFFPNQETFKNFFDKNLYNFNVWESDNVCTENNEEINNKLSKKHFLLYNKVIFYLKSGNLDSVFSTINLYLKNVFPNNNIILYKWVLYVSSTLMLIEIFIYLDYFEIAEMILNSIEKTLFTHNKYYINNQYSLYEEKIFEYLNKNEIMNQFSETWDEVFCYCNLLKTIINVKNSKKYITQYKKLINNCQYINELKIFRRLKMLYICLKVYKNYYLNFQNCFKKLKFLEDEDNMSIFYHNSLGILNLKLKNYFTAEFHFRQALDIYKNCLKKNEKTINIDYNINYICSIEYNISLSYFYQGKYIEAREILLKLSKISIMKNNYKTWFRLGLCSKEIELSKYNLNTNFQSSIINTTKGYSFDEKNNEINTNQNKNINTENNNENNQIKRDDSIDELYNEFSKEHKHEYECENENEENLHNIENIPLKRIILKCTHNSNNPFRNSIYLDESINSFKKVIFLSKKNLYNQKSIKNIIEIYFNEIEKDTEDFSQNYKLRININILCESYLNLIFCLSFKEEWNEIIFIINEFRKRKLTFSEDIYIKIEQYEIEAYLNLKNFEKAKNCIMNCLNKHSEIFQNLNLDYFSKRNLETINEICYKINLFYGLALINIKIRNYKEAEGNIMNIFTFISKKNDLPNFFIDLIIYFNLIKLNDSNLKKEDYIRFKNIILNMIKIRKINLSKTIKDN